MRPVVDAEDMPSLRDRSHIPIRVSAPRPRQVVTERGDTFDSRCPVCFNPLHEHARVSEGTWTYGIDTPSPHIPAPGTVAACPDLTPLHRIPPR